jgi:hypothetical protein
MQKRKTTQRDKGTKGQREPQGDVFPFFVPLILCVEKAFFATTFQVVYLKNGRNPWPVPSNERERNLTAGFATGICHKNLMERLLAFYETGRRNE